MSGEVLYPMLDVNYNNSNPGSKFLVTKEELGHNTAIGDEVSAVTLADVMRHGQSSTFILKLDIQGFDCRVSDF